MKQEKISKIIGELADHHIEDALYCKKQRFFDEWKRWQKAAACVALIIFCSFSMTGIAFASNAGFREMVVTFVTGFSEKEKEQIKNGHETICLDRTDVLIDFLHSFNDNDMGNGEIVTYSKNGFEYVFLDESDSNVNVLVTCESEQLKLLVNMKGEELDGGVRAWKIASYQLISCEEADELLKAFSGESGISTEEGTGQTGQTWEEAENSVISASGKYGKIYHAMHKEKEHIITLTTEETIELKSVFAGYTNDETGWEGQEYHYIIRFEKVRYMMTKDGFVIREDEDAASTFRMNRKDTKKVMNLFRQYHIRFQGMSENHSHNPYALLCARKG